MKELFRYHHLLHLWQRWLSHLPSATHSCPRVLRVMTNNVLRWWRWTLCPTTAGWRGPNTCVQFVLSNTSKQNKIKFGPNSTGLKTSIQFHVDLFGRLSLSRLSHISLASLPHSLSLSPSFSFFHVSLSCLSVSQSFPVFTILQSFIALLH